MTQPPSEPPFRVVNVLGVAVHAVDVDSLVSWMVARMERRERTVVCYVNAHAHNLASDDPWFREFLNAADVCFCDGFGVMLGARLLGARLPERLTPPDWIDRLAAACAARGQRAFLLGGAPGVAEQAAAMLGARHPGLAIAGTHHGFFDKTPGSPASAAVVAQIEAAAPDLLCVGFGMPLQERWIADHAERLRASVIMPVGAMLDYVAGVVPRAPRWLTDRGLEWAGRLVIEPRRLWRRYLLGNPRFLARVVRARFTR